jgi:predicted transposase/invertase (TIGR01784 family)
MFMVTISPRVDIAFKKIFGVEENKDLLLSLINSIVSEEDQVAEVTLLNPYNARNFYQEKLSILDIKARSESGKRYNIEIQISDEADYDKRALYYWAKLYTEQLKTGDDYAFLSKAIGIHILNFTSILNVDKYHNVFHITEKETGLVYFKDLELHTIELTKFFKNASAELSDMGVMVKNSLDMWVAFLTRHDVLNDAWHKKQLPSTLNDPILQKALNVLDVMNFAPDEREAYEGQLKWFMIEANTLRKSREEGRKEGEQIGIAKGREEGEQIGIAKGREEGVRDVRTHLARKMRQEGIDIETISKITGLAVEEIQGE